MRPRKLLQRLRDGHLQDVRFKDVLRLAEAMGFELTRVSGSHYLLTHPQHEAQLNLQDARGEAKPYQMRQLLALADEYDLKLE